MASYEDLEFDQGADVAVALECVDTNGDVKNLSNHIKSLRFENPLESNQIIDPLQIAQIKS